MDWESFVALHCFIITLHLLSKGSRFKRISNLSLAGNANVPIKMTGKLKFTRLALQIRQIICGHVLAYCLWK